MSLPLHKSGLLAVVLVVVLGAVAASALLHGRHPAPAETKTPVTAPATAPAPAETTQPVKPPEPKYAKTLLDVVHEAYPAFPVTQPLAVPLNLSEAARLVLKDPVYFDESGSLLWITRPDARPTDLLLKNRPDDSERVVVTRERVLFAHWMPDETGDWRPYLVTSGAGKSAGAPSGGPTANPPGGYELVSHLGRRPIGSRADYRWDRASSWNESIVVPTATGVSIFHFADEERGRSADGLPGPAPIEQYQDLVDPVAATRPATGQAADAAAPADYAEPQTLLDWKGLLAWLPWDPGKRGGRGAARYVDGKWVVLGSDSGWPDKLLHLIPLRDGSVIQFVLTRAGEGEGDGADAAPENPAGGAGAASPDDPHAWPVHLAVANLDNAEVDRKKITALVDKLGDDDQAVRDAAYNELTQYGPEIWPVLKEMLDDAVPAARVRLKQLLRSQSAPLLGGMVLLGDRVRLVCRNGDGSAVFYSEKGVQTTSEGPDGEPVVQAPAWLAVRPAHAVQLLPPAMVADLKPERAALTAVGEEWVVTVDVRGPRLYVGNHFVDLLKKDESAFAHLVGEDRRGRWVFRPPPAGSETVAKGAENPGAASRPSTSGPATDPATQAVAEAAGETPAPSAPPPPAAPSAPPGTEAASTSPAPARPPDFRAAAGQTLIIDPTLPNLVPQLPIWSYNAADDAGWDKDNWPTVRQLNHLARLKEGGWEVLGEDAVLYNKPEQAPPTPGPTSPPADTQPAGEAGTAATAATPPGTQPATRATTHATTQAATQALTQSTTRPASEAATQAATTPSQGTEAPIWTDRDGTRYFGGIESLRVVSPSGASTTWTLPPAAAGKAPVSLAKTPDGRLFLFNQPGRVLRIKPTPDAAEPFVVEATFTRNVPNVDAPNRIWLDPAGRIIIAYDKNLAILFPEGFVPPAIRSLMSDTDEENEAEGK